MAYKLKKITKGNYKKLGYDSYYQTEGKNKYKFTKETDEGEEIYDDKGNYEGRFD
jgi:hypothetical protein